MNAEHFEIHDSSMPVLDDALTQTDHCNDKVSIPYLPKPNLVTAQTNEASQLPPAHSYL